MLVFGTILPALLFHFAETFSSKQSHALRHDDHEFRKDNLTFCVKFVNIKSALISFHEYTAHKFSL